MNAAAIQALNTYRCTQITSASPETLVLMLYRGAVRQVRGALQALEAGRLPDAHNGLVGAQDIVMELRASLNGQAGDLSSRLDALYDFVQHHLLLANLHKSAPPAQQALEVLEGLLEAWMTAVRQRERASC